MGRVGLLALLIKTWRNIPAILALLFKPSTPLKAKFVILLAILYLLLPYDFIPEWLLGVGLLDDVLIVTSLLGFAAKLANEKDSE